MNISTISPRELWRKLERGDVQLINVLDEKYSHLGLIQGSRRIPLVELLDRLEEIEHHPDVVVYCGSEECPAAAKAAELLERKGFDVRIYEGGLKEWKALKLPIEKQTWAA